MRTLRRSIDESVVVGDRRASGRLWWLYIAAGLAVMGAYFAVPSDGSLSVRIVKVILYCSVSGSAVAAIGFGLRHHRPAQRWPWLLLT
jgi:two-component system cell cycle response regulator